jgi:hypothetical protein
VSTTINDVVQTLETDSLLNLHRSSIELGSLLPLLIVHIGLITAGRVMSSRQSDSFDMKIFDFDLAFNLGSRFADRSHNNGRQGKRDEEEKGRYEVFGEIGGLNGGEKY